MICSKAIECYKEVDVMENNTPQHTDQSGDIDQKFPSDLEILWDGSNTICSEDVEPNSTT